MSQKKGDGDVLANKVSLMQAKSQRLLASLLGPKPETSSENPNLQAENEDDDLKKAFVEPEQLGIGGIAPKDVEDGSFTKRIPTSDDKLLAQLIGNKRAKAHMASKQNAKLHGKQPNNTKPLGASKKREEREDEEEGRAAHFKSKRRKTNKSQPMTIENNEEATAELGDAQERDRSLHGSAIEEPTVDEGVSTAENKFKPKEDRVDRLGTAKLPSRQTKSKPTSFLDEILAERSKKKKRGNKTSTGS